MIFNMTGGGAGLNFKVKAYAPELLLPATAAENTIAVFTSNEMTGWVIDANEPAAPEEGMVWISEGTESDVEFNALKTNSIMVYPSLTKQYISGAWVGVDARIYKDGAWQSLITFLYFEGNEYTSITGGWTTSGFVSNTTGFSPPTKTADAIICKGVANVSHGGVFAANEIDLTRCSYIRFVGKNNSTGTETAMVTNSKNVTAENRIATTTLPYGEFDVKVSVASINSGYVGVVLGDGFITEVSLH